MSARASLAPGSRRGPGVLSSSMSLSSSQSAGPSSQSAFSFRPHVLLSQAGHNSRQQDAAGPLLDFTDLLERIEVFKELFEAQCDQTIQGLKRTSEEHASRIRDEKRNVELTKEAIERQKDEQKKLYMTIASERQAESSAHSQLSHLQSSQTSGARQLAEAEEERDRLQAILEEKVKERDGRRARLVSEVKRNRPELLRFNEKLGCKVSAGSEKTGKGKSTIKFTFNLINSDDWSYEAKFVIDFSKSNYMILSHSPAIPQDKLDGMLSDLNTSRALFTFIKRMRAAFKDEIERQRLAEKAARRAAA